MGSALRLLTTAEAAELVGVTPAVVKMWVVRGKLAPFDRDERGRPLYLSADVFLAQRRKNA